MAENQYVNKVIYKTKEDGTENVLIDISDSTLDQYKIYDGENGYSATGEKITGRLNNWSAVVAGGGGHVIQLYCPFEPKEASVHCYGTPNSKYQIINLMIWKKGGFRKYSSGELENSAYYFAHTSGSSSSNMLSHQIVLGDNQKLFTYDADNNQVYIRSPDDSNYTFQSVNYRVILSR